MRPSCGACALERVNCAHCTRAETGSGRFRIDPIELAHARRSGEGTRSTPITLRTRPHSLGSLSQVTAAHPLVEAEGVGLRLPLHPTRPELLCDTCGMLEETRSNPGADRGRLDPEIVEPTHVSSRDQRRPADDATVHLCHMRRSSRETLGCEVAAGRPVAHDLDVVPPVALRRDRDLAQELALVRTRAANPNGRTSSFAHSCSARKACRGRGVPVLRARLRRDE